MTSDHLITILQKYPGATIRVFSPDMDYEFTMDEANDVAFRGPTNTLEITWEHYDAA